MTIDYCNLTAEQYDNMTGEDYDGWLDCDGDDEGTGAQDAMSRRKAHRRLRQMRPDLRPIIIPFLDLDEIDELLQEGTM